MTQCHQAKTHLAPPLACSSSSHFISSCIDCGTKAEPSDESRHYTNKKRKASWLKAPKQESLNTEIRTGSGAPTVLMQCDATTVLSSHSFVFTHSDASCPLHYHVLVHNDSTTITQDERLLLKSAYKALKAVATSSSNTLIHHYAMIHSYTESTSHNFHSQSSKKKKTSYTNRSQVPSPSRSLFAVRQVWRERERFRVEPLYVLFLLRAKILQTSIALNKSFAQQHTTNFTTKIYIIAHQHSVHTAWSEMDTFTF